MNAYNHTLRRRDDFMAEPTMSIGHENNVSRAARSTRAISIKRNSSCSNDCDEVTDRANYEMATWRMYNRILNHRMMRQGSEGSSSSEDDATIWSEEDYVPPKHAPKVCYFPCGVPPTLPRKGPNLKHWASITLEGDEEGIFQLDL